MTEGQETCKVIEVKNRENVQKETKKTETNSEARKKDETKRKFCLFGKEDSISVVNCAIIVSIDGISFVCRRSQIKSNRSSKRNGKKKTEQKKAKIKNTF